MTSTAICSFGDNVLDPESTGSLHDLKVVQAIDEKDMARPNDSDTDSDVNKKE